MPVLIAPDGGHILHIRIFSDDLHPEAAVAEIPGIGRYLIQEFKNFRQAALFQHILPDFIPPGMEKRKNIRDLVQDFIAVVRFPDQQDRQVFRRLRGSAEPDKPHMVVLFHPAENISGRVRRTEVQSSLPGSLPGKDLKRIKERIAQVIQLHIGPDAGFKKTVLDEFQGDFHGSLLLSDV